MLIGIWIGLAGGTYLIPAAQAIAEKPNCLFDNLSQDLKVPSGLLADGAQLRTRGVYTVKVIDVHSMSDFNRLSEDVKLAVKDVVKANHATLYDFFNGQGMVEYYAAGKAVGNSAGAY